MKPVEIVVLMRDKTRQGIESASQGVDGLSDGYEELIRAIRSSESAMEQSGQSARRMSSDFGSLQSVLAKIGGTAALVGFGKEIIKVRSEFQNTEASFKVFLGSAEKAAGFMKELQSYAFNNVFEFKDLTQQASQLLAYQHSLADVIPIIDKLSNIAAGANVPLEQLVELYNKAKSQGKLLMMDIQQWQRAGVPVIQELAKQFNTTEDSIRDMVSAGKVGFKEIDSVVNNLTSTGGMFAGMMEEKMKTLGDSVGLLQDSLTAMFNEIGEKSQGFLRGGILLTNTLVENYEKVGKTLISLIATYGAYRAAVLLNILVEQGWMTTQMQLGVVMARLNNIIKALYATMSAHPAAIVTAAIVALVTAVWALRDSTTAEDKALKELNAEMDKYDQKVKERKSRADELIRLIKDETETEQAKIRAIKELKELYPAIFGNMDVEAIKLTNEIDLKKKRNQQEEIYTKEIYKQIIAESEARKAKWHEAGLRTPGQQTSYFSDMIKAEELRIEQAKKALEELEKVEKEATGSTDNQKITQNKSYWENIKKDAEDARNALDVAEKNSEKWIEYAKQIEEAQKQIDIYSDKRQSSGGTSADKFHRDAQAQSDLLTKIANNETKAELERHRSRLENDQKLLDIEQDGWDKRQKQIELNYQKELLAIDKHTQELIEKQQEAERLRWEMDGKKGVFIPQITSVIQLPEEQKNELLNMETTLNKTFEAENQKLHDELINRYQTYADKRLEIEKKFNDDLAAMQSQNVSGELDFNISELEKQRKQNLKEISDAESAELVKVTNLFVRLFTDASTQSVDQVKRVIDETQALYDYLASTKNEDITANFGFTAEQLRSFQANAEQMKSILDGINAKKRELGDRSPVDAFIHSLKDAKNLFSKGGNDNLKLGVEKIGAATKDILPYVNQLGNDLSAIFGEDIGNLVNGATEALNSVMNVAEGFAKGGVIGGIAAVVGEVAKLFTKAAEAEKRHQEALKEIANEKLAMQRKYNLLLLEQNLLLKEATTIFGEKEITKAANAINVYRDAIALFEKELQGKKPNTALGSIWWLKDSYQKQLDAYNQGVGALNTIQIKTGHEKTGLFGWGKGRDVYSSILDIYGKDKLLNPDGSLNIDFAKTILDTQTLSDENRNLLQSLIDLQEQANEAQDALRDYLKETFGVLGSDLMDSIVSSIKDKGIAAWEAFGKAGSKVIENLGKQLAYELFFADKFAKLQKDLEAIYGQVGKSPEEIANEAMQLVGDFYNGIGDDMDAAQAFMENWQREAEKHGFDLWQPETVSQTGKSGAFTTMTQDQAGKLEGLFTSLQNHAASIDDRVINISDAMYDALDTLTRIAENTEYCRFLKDVSEDMKQIIRDGLRVK